MKIDISCNFQKETGSRDADRYSVKLQEYHRQLWSKSLPNGQMFTLEKTSQNRLHHSSTLGEFYLSSDRATATFSWRKNAEVLNILAQFDPNEIEEFRDLSETIGAIMIWPSNRIDGMSTINGARGMNRKIADRLDLTLECIRRYYQGEDSPLYVTLLRYEDFFDLFGDFKGYVDFFLLQDYVSTDYRKVNMAVPVNDFGASPVPKNAHEYERYMKETIRLIKARNARIEEFANKYLV